MSKKAETCRGLVQQAVTYNKYTPDLIELQKWDLHPVFVYGSLKKNFFLHWYLEKEKFVATGATSSYFSLFNFGGSFPVLTIQKALPKVTKGIPDVKVTGRVTGELYLVRTETMRRLDMVEGNGDMYRRLRLPVEFTTDPIDHGDLKDRVGMNAWVYVGIPQFWEKKHNLSPYETTYVKGIPTLTYEEVY